MYSEFSLFKTYVEKQFFEVLSVLSDLKSAVCLNDHHDHVTEDVAGDVSSLEATQSMLSKKSDDGDHDAVETSKDVFESGTAKEDHVQNDGQDGDKKPEDDSNCIGNVLVTYCIGMDG
ncbi:uncharacterized protein LOC126688294 [Mercurialis annua]|uniref:uncharacterized protein LOC126688294 n=1 Tax=Mercurialis annua TaxID=3986 RepID=UPI00215F8A19|nr:uncharacterized protein LOC126688294 [Mercurialis annua]